MLLFKKDFNHPVKHHIEIVVDNARTNNIQLVNINEFQLKPGGRCPFNYLNYADQDDKIKPYNVMMIQAFQKD
jgi:hypothetical protein